MEPTRIKKHEKYTVKICANCFKHSHKNKFIETTSLDDAIYDLIEQRFKNAKKVELYIPEHKQNPGLVVGAEATVDNVIVPVNIEYTVCPYCSRMVGQAFNGILQLRNPTKEITDFIKTEFKKVYDKGIHCIKQDEVPNGIDYFITAAQFTRHLGKLLQNKFGGELKETARLVSRSSETSKDLFRVSVLFRYPGFKKGDVVSYNGKDVKIINFSNKVYVSDLKTNKKQQLNYNQIKIKHN